MRPRQSSVALFLALIGFLFASGGYAKDAAAFCKCICGDESQIIALNPPDDAGGSSGSGGDDGLMRRFTTSFTPALDTLRMSSMRRRDDDGNGEGDEDDDPKDATKRRKTCADCTRQLCLDYNLPKCKTLPAEKVTTDCFKRDSSKDQAVVLIFIAATVSLLLWAILKPWMSRFLDTARDRSAPLYRPVAGDGTE